MFQRKESNGFKTCKTQSHLTLDVLNVTGCFLIVACILVQPLHAAIDGDTKTNGDSESAAGTQTALNNKNDELSIAKRAAGQRAYNFGLGKRDSEATFDEPESDDGEIDSPYDKRESQRFSFGLGKREYRTNGDSRFSFGLGKRDLSDDDDYAKRSAPMQRYQFGLGKKSAPSRYAFGLGKRQHYVPRQYDDLFKRRYSFGLGK